MSFHWCDNIHTSVFTPRDYQVELLASAFERNTMVCLGHKSSKGFITLKLLQELARQSHGTNKCSVYLTCRPADEVNSSMSTMLQQLTDLKVFLQPAKVAEDFLVRLLDYDVYIVHPRTLYLSLKKETFKLDKMNLLVLEDCHENDVYEEIVPIFQEFYHPTQAEMPKVLGLAGPLHSAECALQELGAMLNSLEEVVQCSIETASDIVTVLRYCAKPIEFIAQCAPFKKDELTTILEDILCTRKAYLINHRYDPTEIYSTDEFLEELKDIPDPKKEPLEFLDILLTVLNEMGPWCADRVALNMLHRIEKLKIKTPHERHYLLLCLVNTALFEVRAVCEQTFRKYSNHKEIVERYSSPKVLRLLEILRHFKPDEFSSENETIQRLSQDLEQLDFKKVTRTLEYSCQNVENVAARQQLESRSIIENLDAILKDEPEPPKHKEQTKFIKKKEKDSMQTASGNPFSTSNTFQNRRGKESHGRTKRKPYIRRGPMRGLGSGENGDGLDTICGTIFCNSNYTARVLFELLAEMSRHDADLKFLKCQYTTDRVADPLREPKEAEQEHRRQEETLKRFRIHDCNVLIGTTVLEEGIDLPKCNLVVRWDAPTTYRSYVQCKGRARASPAYHVILVASKFDVTASLECKQEQVQDRTHHFLCKLDESQQNSIESDSNEDENSDDDKILPYTSRSVKGTVRILNPEVITHQPPVKSELRLNEIQNNEISVIERINSVENHLENAENGLILTEITDDSLHSDDSFAMASETSLDEFGEFELKDISKAIAKLEQDLKEKNLKTISKDKSFNLFKDVQLDKALVTDLNGSKVNKIKANFETNDSIIASTITQINGDNPNKECKSKKSNSLKTNFKCLLEDMEIPPIEDKLLSIKESAMHEATKAMVEKMSEYREMEKMLIQKCANFEPPDSEHLLADIYTPCVEVYKPQPHLLTGASVNLSTSIALVNKYCSKLPSDTFTKLTALYRCAKTIRNDYEMFQYTIRLPINSPLKYDIVGLPMPTNILARRMAAFQACIELHKSGELDANLQPIGKEGFRAMDPEWEVFELEEEDKKIIYENCEPRPGTTKRRQYYYKRIATEFCDCRPIAGVPCFLYLLDLTLQCPIPEEQNTRGRKIYPPEDAQQGFGILTLKRIPKVSSFPIFTRSGEVKVSIELAKEKIILTEDQIRCINIFVNYTFTNVLRLQKFLMIFDPDSTENCIFIVPTVKTSKGKIIDWQFLESIEKKSATLPATLSVEERSNMNFDSNRFKDAVVMPWYRNQDQPQYFYVAEICPQLSPMSCFPGENYNTFKHYYFLKYDLEIQNVSQPLLDVDHTSARLNFLTPRYVNRKGVALPTSSEETKRAKRENLEQKQILVPELCTVHPFPASLWRTAVCLPCILYRINGLLLADEIRRKVSNDIALGNQEVNEDFEWPMLDFGWSFSEVLKKSKERQQQQANEESKLREGSNVNGEINNTENDNGSGLKEKSGSNKKDLAKAEKSANEICKEGEKQLQENLIEIGTWSNDMAEDIDFNKKSDMADDEDDELMEYLPSNVSFCDQQVRYGSPTFWDLQEKESEEKQKGFTTQTAKSGKAFKSSGHSTKTENISYYPDHTYTYYDSDDSFASSYESVDEEDDTEDLMIGPYHIAFTSKNEAESYETAEEVEQREKQLSIIQATTANERSYQQMKNRLIGYNFTNLKPKIQEELRISNEQFVVSTQLLKEQIRHSGMLVTHEQALTLPHKNMNKTFSLNHSSLSDILESSIKLCPYISSVDLMNLLQTRANNAFTLADLERLNLQYIRENSTETFTIIGTGDIFDNFNDKNQLIIERQNKSNSSREYTKRIKLNFQHPSIHAEAQTSKLCASETQHTHLRNIKTEKFSFDYQPDLAGHPGPSPSILLQALTMSNANDGINLERLETIGDSFLKYAITTYLYITYENVHEGKLSHLRSKQVANLNLYRLGRRKILGEYMIATKFEPHDNWLPPCYYVPKELEKALIEAKIPPHHWKLVDLANIKKLSCTEICQLVKEKADKLGLYNEENGTDDEQFGYMNEDSNLDDSAENNDFTCFIPYNLVTQHSIPDKSIADCVEALIGAYLIECGPRGALIFMAWLGIKVLPFKRELYEPGLPRPPGSILSEKENMITVYGDWTPPQSPLLRYAPNAEQELETMLEGFDEFEAILGYKFRDRSYLLQAMTHASYSPNRLTDCYQRLEFLGDAVLDYLITRHLYEDAWQHSPGALTDLRSALVNNTIFASLAVRHGFHKYFRHLSPGLNEVIDRFVRIQNENGHNISEEYYLVSEEECDDAEDVEVPKALGDVFESVAGAIFLDSGMSLDTVWEVYNNMMKPEIELFSSSVPKSPIRELLELEPETAKFGKPEKLADGRRVRVTVDVFCKGTFRGIGRNYRIAKNTAAKCALRGLRKNGLHKK